MSVLIKSVREIPDFVMSHTPELSTVVHIDDGSRTALTYWALEYVSKSPSTMIAIIIDIPGRSVSALVTVSPSDGHFKSNMLQSPAATVDSPGWFLNVHLISVSSASMLHSEENGKMRFKASSTLTGSCRYVNRVSILTSLVCNF